MENGFGLMSFRLGHERRNDLPSMTPARRRYLLSYAGKAVKRSRLQRALEQLQGSATSDQFYFEFQCAETGAPQVSATSPR